MLKLDRTIATCLLSLAVVSLGQVFAGTSANNSFEPFMVDRGGNASQREEQFLLSATSQRAPVGIIASANYSIAPESVATIPEPSVTQEGDLDGEGEAAPHVADLNGDWSVALAELLRAIQFYNAEGLHCAASPGESEDGYLPGPNPAAHLCPPHDSDYLPQDWMISLSELLRLIQLYNAGIYRACPAGEDGYCPEKRSPLLGTLNEVDAAVADIPPGEPEDRVQAIADYLATRPEFVETGIAASTVSAWGRTENGEILCVVDTLPLPSAGLVSVDEVVAEGEEGESPKFDDIWAEAVYEKPDALPVNRTEMPGGINCHLVSSDHVASWLHNNALAMVLRLAGRGRYQQPLGSSGADVFRNGSIERLALLNDTGIFYTHSIVSAAKLPNGDEVAALLTSDDVTAASEATYRNLLRDGSLVIMLVPNMHTAQTEGPERLRRFGITSKFIREKMRLANNALVYIDAGYGNHDDLRQAFLDIGASVYLAWNGMPSNDAKPNKSAIFFSQHMVNEDFADPLFSWADSPTRPFDYQNVYSMLMARGFGRDTPGLIPSPDDPYLSLTEGDGDLAILSPSIAYLVVDENPENPSPETALLHIYGSFGSDPGAGNREVLLRREPLQIESWSPSEITCLIPARDSAGHTSGRVIVVNRGVESNATPLTEWYLPVTMFTRNDVTGFYDQANFTLHLRLDVHGYRSILNQPYPLPAPPASLYGNGLSVGRYSSGSWVCGGAYSDLSIHEYPAGMEPVNLGGIIHNYWFEQSGSGNFIFRPDFIGSYSAMYATAAPFYAPVTLENPKPPVRIRIQLAYNAIGNTIAWGFVDTDTGVWAPAADYVPRLFGSPISEDLGWVFDLDLDAGFAILPGAHDAISWQRAEASELSAPEDTDPR